MGIAREHCCLSRKQQRFYAENLNIPKHFNAKNIKLAINKDMMQTFDIQVKIARYGVVYINKLIFVEGKVFETKCVNEKPVKYHCSTKK